MAKRLTDILGNSEVDAIRQTWAATEASGESGPLPGGEYLAVVGGVRRRQNWHAERENPARGPSPSVHESATVARCWLTPAAMPGSKRDLMKLGILDLEQLNRPIPPGIIVSVKVALRKDDDGTERNRLTKFDVLRIEPPMPNPFTPTAPAGAPVAASNGIPEPDSDTPF